MNWTKVFSAITLGLIVVLARAEPVIVKPILELASTSWSYTDTQGQYREMRFEPDGSLWIAYLRVLAKRNKDDPSGLTPGDNEYEMLKERGKWTQDGGSVRIVTSDEETTELPGKIRRGDSVEGLIGQLNAMIAEGKKHPIHPTITYVGTVQEMRISGTVSTSSEPQDPNSWRWTAEKILDPKELWNGGPKVLISCMPNIFRFQAKLLSKNVKSGSAIVKAEVSSAGEVIKVSLVKATRKEFGDCALEAVSHWRFSPKVKNGEAVTCTVTLPLEFKLTSAS